MELLASETTDTENISLDIESGDVIIRRLLTFTPQPKTTNKQSVFVVPV